MRLGERAQGERGSSEAHDPSLTSDRERGERGPCHVAGRWLKTRNMWRSCASSCQLVMTLLLAAYVFCLHPSHLNTPNPHLYYYNLTVYERWQRYERDITKMLDDMSKTREQVMDEASARVRESGSLLWQLRGVHTLQQCRLMPS